MSAAVTPLINSDEENNQLRQLTDLVVRSPELRELEKLLGKFNLFRVLRFEQGEIRHSNVLAWLLDPYQSHGLGDLYFRKFLMRVVAESQSENADKVDVVELDSLEIRRVVVLREWRNIDLVLRIETFDQEEWVVAIENKVQASQTEGQLKGYRAKVEESFPTASKRIFIFLTQLEEDPGDSAYISASYKQVHDVLAECIEEQRDVIGPEPRVLLNHYLSILEEVFMEGSRVADLAQRIYQTHRDALEVIFEHRPDELQNLSESLKRRMADAASELNFEPMVCNKGYIRFLPKAWKTEENLKGKAWGSKGSAFVLCELVVSGSWPVFKIVEGKAPEPWRSELWNIAQESSFKKTQKRAKKPEMWMSLYSVKNSVINLKDLELGQEDEIAAKTWDWVKKQLRDRDFETSVERVAEHLAKLRAEPGEVLENS